ncbi:NUDIX hydrolase [Mammaliicoccus stepanovicii]|uniref:Nucleoside triphosphate pyrophosphohydrolase n=1 Tax=Mammaliicoccus stepanovicii TaxID=643214 RepID=A0A239YG60_9STAP|nr:NUDIX domain-containing protein [Mammaliicoccus stepanovicii]PNZ74689.1 hypothetical protein CD111_08545 [Mammaliicoccus stepanovicii]GGI40847.1 hypothetical protein GCM10010896_10410 [Mammaliicoccus stepanovicii]SNV58241.1 nucleoside triphosphate pyrophosphohydrolase [Mammaliicoccus stepanovicii]
MDLTLKSGEGMLNIRVGAIVKAKDQYIFHHDKHDHYYALIGGRVKYFESSDSAIKRELKEEIGIDIDNFKFLTTIQNFFEFKGTSYHEILFVYEVNIENSIEQLNLLDDPNISYASCSIEEIPDLIIKPYKAKEIILRHTDVLPLFISKDED